MITGIHHIAVRTTDIERSARFYSEVLNFTEVRRLHFDDGSYLILMALGETMVELFGGGAGPRQAETGSEIGYTHLALTVDDVEREYDRISALGYDFYIKPQTVQGIRCAFFRDPDGLPVEIIEPLPPAGAAAT